MASSRVKHACQVLLTVSKCRGRSGTESRSASCGSPRRWHCSPFVLRKQREEENDRMATQMRHSLRWSLVTHSLTPPGGQSRSPIGAFLQFLATREKKEKEKEEVGRQTVPSAKGSCPTRPTAPNTKLSKEKEREARGRVASKRDPMFILKCVEFPAVFSKGRGAFKKPD